jgi:hypothetical protein
MAARDASKADYWRRVIRRQVGSGLSVRAWCGRQEVPEASFYWWRRRLGRSGAAGHPSRRRRVNPPRFVPVRVTADPAGAADRRPDCIEIILSGERRVRVFGPVDRQALAGVLAVLHADDTDRVNPAGDREAAAC